MLQRLKELTSLLTGGSRQCVIVPTASCVGVQASGLRFD
jgi:hypothetical protein